MKITVLGSGPGGYVLALKAAQMGAEVVVVEDREVGGTCLNRGCIPTKTLLASSELYGKMKRMAAFGFDLDGRITPNMKKIMARKEKIIATQVMGIHSLFKSWGVQLRRGRGELLSDRQVLVKGVDGEETITSDRIVIATGSKAGRIPTFPFDGKKIISSTDALELTEIPKRMLIVGAGVMGCEFACIYSELGTEVTIVELLPRAIATEDEEISALMERELRKKKIKLIKQVKAERLQICDDGVHTFISDGQEIITDKVLVAIGRTFNSEGIGLQKVGIRTGRRGEIEVNRQMSTNIDGVYAIGDVTGGLLLAHTASSEAVVAAVNMLGGTAAMDYDVVAAAIFTTPEIASVGLREHQAREANRSFITGRFQYRALGKAHAIGEISGIFKVIADRKTDRLLGAHIIGPHASDIIHEAAVAIRAGLTIKELTETIHAHPTLAEGFVAAAEDAHKQAIHLLRKEV